MLLLPKRYFADGEINLKSFDKAVNAARKEIAGIANTYKAAGWDTVVGSSGTIKACCQICCQYGLEQRSGRTDT